MVETITPVVYGGSRGRWAGAVLVHALAAASVAAAFGGLLGGVGRVLGAPWGGGAALLVGVAAAWALAHEVGGVPFPVPQLRRQVPDWWRTFFPPFASAALYGGALGIGFLTYLLRPTLVVVSLAAVASGRPGVGAALLAPFGLARGLSALAAARGPDVVAWLAGFAARRFPIAAANAISLAAIAVLVGAAARSPVDLPGIAGAVLAGAFAWSAGWKLTHADAWRRAVLAHAGPPSGPGVVIAVPVAEALVVALVVAGARRTAALLALALLTVFTLAAVRRRLLAGRRVPCGCFGEREVSLPVLLTRNAALVAVALVAARDGTTLVEHAAPSAAEVVPAALAALGAVGVVAMSAAVVRSLARGRT